MKYKKIIIIGITIVVLLLTIIGLTFFLKSKVSQEDDIRKPDMVIKSTKKEEIKLDGFKVEKINIYKTTDTSLDVKATIVNQSDKTVKGFFIQIGLFDKDGKRVTVVSEDCEKEIRPKEKYMFESGVAGNKRISEVTNAKVLSIEKDIKSSVDEAFNEMEEWNQ